MKIRLLGDIHSKYSGYLNLIKEAEYSIQLGDFGFNYDILESVDSNKHRVILGNHETVHTDNNGELIKSCEHILDNFGVIKTNSNIPDMFYIRGGHSIDKFYRTEGVDWFKDEELTYFQMLKAVEYYAINKPKIVISHETPASMIPYVANPNFNHLKLKPSATAIMLEEMYRIHQPDFWFHAHYHLNKWYKPDHTNFFCIDELSYIDLNDTYNGYKVDAQYYNVTLVNKWTSYSE